MARSSTDFVDTQVSLRAKMDDGDLGDTRLNARRDRLVEVLEQSPATGFPEACASDGDVEALYRFCVKESQPWATSVVAVRARARHAEVDSHGSRLGGR